MGALTLHKVTAVPAINTVSADEMYLITDASNSNYFELYLANNDGSAMRRIPTRPDIEAMITSAIGASGSVVFADDIDARDALTPTNGMEVFVIDASDDATVTAGSAKYIYRSSNTTWLKISESESQDLAITWASITDGPSSTPAQIDSTVAASHTHANKTQLDKISQGADGELNYDSTYVKTAFETVAW